MIKVIKWCIRRIRCKHDWEYVPLLTIQKEKIVVVHKCQHCGHHKVGKIPPEKKAIEK